MSDNDLKGQVEEEIENDEIKKNIEVETEEEIEQDSVEGEIIEEEDDEVIEVKEKEYQKLVNESKDYQDKMLRALAELENFRKRNQKDREQYLKFSNENIIRELIDIYDNFNRALEHIDDKNDEASIKNIIEGIKMIQKQLFNILEKNGVEEIKCEGEEFDPKIHEAVQVVETEDSEDEIVQVLQKGYKMHDKIIKPSMVAVSKKK